MNTDKKSNVIHVKPRRHQVVHKGLHAWVEYVPSIKMWRAIVKLVYRVTHVSEHKKEEEAVLHAKHLMDVAAEGNNKNVRTED